MIRATRIFSVLPALLLGAFVMSTAHAWAQAGPVGTSVQQYSGGVRWPDVAYDSNNRVFLVVWGPGTIRGIFVSEDGNPIGSSFRISDIYPWAQTPRAVFNPDTGVFLVAWQSSDGIVGNASATVVRGRMVSYTSGVSALPTKVYSGNTYSTRWETGPALAYSNESGNFMVVWNRYSSTGAEVGARLVSPAGDAVGSEIVITSTSDEYEREPTVGCLPGSNRFLVAWAASGLAVDSVRGKLYDASTGALSGTPLLFAQSTFTYVPEAALNRTTGQLLVTWMQNDPATALPGNGWRPFGRLVDGNGAFVSGSPTRLSSIAGAYDANSVAFNALTQSFFLVTHGSTSLQDVGFEISGTGTPASTASAVTSVTAANLTGTFNPRINASSQAARWLVATSASFASLWTQVVAGGGDGGGTTNPRLTISPTPARGTVTGGGLMCGTGGTSCQLTFTQATPVTLTATADTGYIFTAWGGACSGTSTTTTVQVDSAKACSATFGPSGSPTNYTLTIAPTPANGTVSGGGLSCGVGGAVCQVQAASGTSVMLTAVPSSGYTFTSWGGGCAGTSATTTVLMNVAKTCTASFTPGLPYTMTINPRPTGGTISGAGLNCGVVGTQCSVTMPAPMGMGLQATAASGYAFGSWTGDCTGTNPSLTLQLAGPRTCGANFNPVGGTTYQLNVSPAPTGGTVSGGGITCGTGGSSCQATYGSSTSVTLTAAPATGFTFTSWGGSCTGTSASTTVQVNAIKTCSATFATGPVNGPPYTMTISPKPAGGTVTGAGLNCGTGGSLCAVTMPASMGLGMLATPASGYTFTGWTGACTGTNPSLTLQLAGPRTCGATFTPVGGTTYQLNVSPGPTGGTVTGGGIACGTGGSTCQATYGSSTSVTLTAAPASGYTFTSWGGSCSGTSTSTTVQVDAVRTCSATFTAGAANGPPYTMTVSPRPTGGTVTGAGLNCGTTGSMCAVTMPAAMSLGIQATPSTGYTFSGWTGDCTGTNAGIYVWLGGSRTCGATFSPIGGTTYRLSVSPVPAGGTVTGGGIACGTGGSTCQATYGSSTSVTLTAAPASGYTFTSWGGNCTGTSASATIQVDGVKTCTATFTAGTVSGPPYTMTISPRPTGGTVTGAGLNCGTGGNQCAVTMPAPMSLGIQATAAAGYTFTGWTGNCTGTNPGIYVWLGGPRSCSATFTPVGGGGD